MDIINTIITHTATEQTATAAYSLDYTVTNGTLTQVQVSIRSLPTENGDPERMMGNIFYNQGIVNCNIPYEESLLPTLFSDFEILLGNIRASIEDENMSEA